MESKTKKVLMLAMAALISGVSLFAQTLTIKGTIVDSDGLPLPGAAVTIKGTTTGVVADINGAYEIKASNGDVLVFQYLGCKDKEIVAIPTNTVVNVVLELDSTVLEGTVVTALGITRAEKSLGYAVTKVESETLNQTTSANWVNNLNGKVAGLAMTGSGGAGGSVRVTLRGDSSLNWGKNEALFVVDGVPILSGYTASTSNTSYANGDSPIDFGNGVTDLNPDDIEEVSVLKGPSATALYGSRAANGAIVITTKKGRSDQGWGISFSTGVTFENAMRYPDFQTEYGPSASTTSLTNTVVSAWGLPGSLTDDGKPIAKQISRYAYGEKFDANKMRYLYQSKNWETGEFTKVPWVYADDWYTGIFQTGLTFTNSLSLDGNTGKGTSTRLSITDSRNKGVLPNTGHSTTSVALNINHKLNKHIELNAKFTYVNKSSSNMPAASYDESSAMYGLLWGYNAYPMSNYRDEYFKGRYTKENYEAGERGSIDPYDVTSSLVYNSTEGHNPYRVLYEELNTLKRNRVFGNASANVKIIDGLTLTLRAGIDFNNDFRTQQKPKLSADYINGMYREQTITEYEINGDFLLRYNKNFVNDRLGINVAFGGNIMHWRKNNAIVTAPQLDIEGPGMYSLSNSAVQLIGSSKHYDKQVQSLYGFINLSWDDTYFLDVTGRNDWSSTLAPGNWSYFYPSVSATILLDKSFKITSHYVNLLKLRASWANVGNDTDPYSLYDTYSATNLDGGYRIPGSLKYAQIKPENVASVEVGLDTRFFDNRIGIDAAIYQNTTTNQIISASMSYEIGATSLKMNAGEIRNRGVELTLHLVPVRTRDFEWTIDANWTTFSTVLVKLNDEWDPTQPLRTSTGSTVGGRTYIQSFIGQEMQQIYGKRYNRAPEGSTYVDENGNTVDCSGALIIDANTGYPSLCSQADQWIAKVNPDWRGGINTTFRFRGFSLTANFTGQKGGHAFSVTNFALSYQGKLKNSLEGRYAGLVVDGVNLNADGTYSKNTTITENVNDYYNKFKWVRDNTEENTFSTDFFKLKELRLEYRFPEKLMKASKALQGASIAAYAQNVFCISKWPQYDPESATQLNGGNIMSGIEAATLPMTRSYGFNIKLQF
ncbi:MAG: SusC/RagA family TonB-linked outer membrane protein [Bacteroidales bacterium]|nr:SusC/RagA family TonB-linked outer membrane protein [Bacteroidales bacterium]